MPNNRSEARRALLLTIILLAVIAATVWHFAPLARAKPSAEWGTIPPEVSAWAKRQHNSRGEWCCSEADGHLFYGDYTINADGSVTVEGETIPKDKVLNGYNPTGTAVWWRLDTADGSHRTYCFALGGGT